MLFPILGLIAYKTDGFLGLRSTRAYMFYQLFISVSMIIYELYSCTCGHHEEPNFLYKPNDLKEPYDEVWSKRKEYNINKKMKKTNSQFANTGF